MINLLRNSVKFTTQGVIKLTAECYFSNDTGIKDITGHDQTPRQWLKLEFYDTGLGIKEQDLKSLFKLFGKLNDP
jgi:signal transduction histidine kinase